MKIIRISSIYLLTWVLTLTISHVNPLKENIKSGNSTNITSSMNSDTSHEDTHSKSVSVKHMVTSTPSPNVTPPNENVSHKTVKRILINTNRTHPLNSTESSTRQTNKNVAAMEGGSISLPDITKHKTAHDNNTLNSNRTSKILSDLGTTTKTVDIKIVTSLVPGTASKTSESPMTKSIHHSPTILHPETSSSSPLISSSTPMIRKHKPVFTIVPNDEDNGESDSFIESSTTGRDYVLPIVLVILALPLIGYLIKLIYRRGTEFTERQQYHRMYLIDGMYNSR